jgi:hypothetical protein
MLCSQRTENCKSPFKIFLPVFFSKISKKEFRIISYFRSYKDFRKNVCQTQIMVKVQHGYGYVRNGGFYVVFGKTRILLRNPDTPIERSHKKNV